MNDYLPAPDRYEHVPLRRCGRSGVQLPAISLGLWHNFGSVDVHDTCRAIARTAFDNGVFHFDLANNYGPEPGSAESTFGRILREDLVRHRDELVVSTKAGYFMWPGPYGDHGSRKYLVASCDQSLRRLGLDYVDIFYHHRPDPDTDLEESMLALDHIVRSGRALYVGISNYNAEQTRRATAILRELKTPFVIHQFCYNLLNRGPERDDLPQTLLNLGLGGICFSPLAQGLLTARYLSGDIPADSRAGRGGFLKPSSITPELLERLRALDAHAKERGQTLAQMSLAWLLSRPGVTSALVGASRPAQLLDSLGALSNADFTADELALLDRLSGACP